MSVRSDWVSTSWASDQLYNAGSHSHRPGALVGVALIRAVRVAEGVREGLAVDDAVAVGVGERQGSGLEVGVCGGRVGASVGVGTVGSDAQGRSGWKMATPAEPVLT